MLVRIHEFEVGAIMHPSLSLPFIISIPKAASAGRPSIVAPLRHLRLRRRHFLVAFGLVAVGIRHGHTLKPACVHGYGA